MFGMSIRSDIVRKGRSDIEPALVAHELAVLFAKRRPRSCMGCPDIRSGPQNGSPAWCGTASVAAGSLVGAISKLRGVAGRILILILIFIFGADIHTPWFLLA
jgi:hypothetical protein